MKIDKIELIDNGLNGIVISGARTEVKENNTTIVVGFEDTYKVPMTLQLRKKVQDLKVFMATALNVGIESAVAEAFKNETEKLDTEKVSLINFLDSLTITKVSKKDDIFYLSGKVCNLDNVTMGLACPKITPKTSYGFYDKLNEQFIDITDDLKKFMESAQLITESPREYMHELFANDTDQQANLETLSDFEVTTMMIQRLEAAGHVIISPPEDLIIPETPTASSENSDFPIIREEQSEPIEKDEF